MSNYTILPGDLLALAPLIRAENDLYQMLSSAPSEVLSDFVAQVDSLSFSAYPTGTGSQIQSWVDELFTTLIQTTTQSMQECFYYPTEAPVTCIYIAYVYSDWLNHSEPCDPSMNGSICFGCFIGEPEVITNPPPPWPRPQQSAAWNSGISQAISLLASGNPSMPMYIVTFPTFWTDYANVPKNSPLWTDQAAALKSLQAQTSLTAGQCPFLLYLLLAQTTSSDLNEQKPVSTISNAPVSSPELPNSTFADQLVYFTLMYLNDPRGPCYWTNEQILAFVTSLIAAIPANPTSSTLSAVLKNQQNLLNAYGSYPGIDPNNPTIAFNERYSDVLFAMNLAWPTIPS